MAVENIPIAHDKNGVRVFGPHADGAFNMSINGSWVSAMFNSVESALSWSGDTVAAEELWSGLGKSLPLHIKSRAKDSDTSREAVFAAFQRAYETLVTDGMKRQHEQDRDRMRHAFNLIVEPILSERDAERAAKEKAEAEQDAAIGLRFEAEDDMCKALVEGDAVDHLRATIARLQARIEASEKVIGGVLESPSCQCAPGGFLSVHRDVADSACAWLEEKV